MEKSPKPEIIVAQQSDQQIEAELLTKLQGIVATSALVEVQAVHGCAVTPRQVIETDFIPNTKKLTVVYTGKAEEAPTQYYVKTEGYDPVAFQVPAGRLKPKQTYEALGFSSSTNGLVIDVGYQGQGYNYFYLANLNNIKLSVVDKSDFEKTQESLKNFSYRFHSLGFHDRAIRELAGLTASLLELTERLEKLPSFDIRSSFRYSVDLSGGGTLYYLNQNSKLVKLEEFGLTFERSRYGNFHGNRIEVIGDKIVLIDEQTKLALGAVYIDPSNRYFGDRYLGFTGFGAVDTRDKSWRTRPSSNQELFGQFARRIKK